MSTPVPTITSLAEYQAAAVITAKYPRPSLYPFLGLAGETGELLEVLRDTPEEKEDVVKEFGDVFWYFSAICTDLGLHLEEQYSNMEADGRQAELRTDLPIIVGKIMELAKKSMRDENGKWSDDRLRSLSCRLMELSENLNGMMDLLSIKPLDVMQVNIAKLYSRMDRNMIQGSGNSR